MQDTSFQAIREIEGKFFNSPLRRRTVISHRLCWSPGVDRGDYRIRAMDGVPVAEKPARERANLATYLPALLQSARREAALSGIEIPSTWAEVRNAA